MSLGTLCQARSQLTGLGFIVLLCLGYFNHGLIVEAVRIFFQISSLTGKVLVNKFLTVCNWTFEIIKLTYMFFQVLYEDSLIFFNDATEKLSLVVFLLVKVCLLVEDFGWRIVKGLIQLEEIASSILAFLYDTVATFKEGIQLLGSTIWHFFTTLPEIIIFNINGFYTFLLNTSNEFIKLMLKIDYKIIESLEKAYFFLFDIKLDSLYGLLIGGVLLTVLCMKFKNICSFVGGAFLKIYKQFISFGSSLWSGRFLEQTSRRNVDYTVEDDERLCIVCQYNLKETIIFPCKHLCLCGDCSLQLTKNRPVCPICRSDITGTLKVYL